MRWLDQLAPVLFLVGLITGRFVRARALSPLTPTVKARLVSSFDHHQVYSVAILAALAALYALSSPGGLPVWLFDSLYFLALAGFVLLSATVARQRRASSDLPLPNVLQFALALGLQYAALALVIGLALRF